MTEYVCGFLFNKDYSRVALIKKNKPKWQAGKYNGIGGKIKPNESPIHAMVREFEEETGVRIESDKWSHFAVLSDKYSFRVWFFKSQVPYSSLLPQLKQPTTEIPDYFYVNDLPETLPNVHWLIPMAQWIDKDSTSVFDIKELP